MAQTGTAAADCGGTLGPSPHAAAPPHLRHAGASVQRARLVDVWLVVQPVHGGAVADLAHWHRLPRQHVLIHNRLAPAPRPGSRGRGRRRRVQGGRRAGCTQPAACTGGLALLPACPHPPDERHVAGQDARVHHHHVPRQQVCGVDGGDAPRLQHLHLARVVRQRGQAAAVLVGRHHVGDDGEEGDGHDDEAVTVVGLRAPAAAGGRRGRRPAGRAERPDAHAGRAGDARRAERRRSAGDVAAPAPPDGHRCVLEDEEGVDHLLGHQHRRALHRDDQLVGAVQHAPLAAVKVVQQLACGWTGRGRQVGQRSVRYGRAPSHVGLLHAAEPGTSGTSATTFAACSAPQPGPSASPHP